MTSSPTESFYAEIWQKAREEIANKLNAETFDSFIKNLEFVNGSEETIELAAKGDLAAFWIRDNYLDIITNDITLAAGRKFSVVISTVADETIASQTSSRDMQKTLDLPEPKQSKLSSEHKATLSSIFPRYTFETFVVGESNRFAHALALAVAQNPGVAFNPLFIYGATGLGKTHLMNAIAHFVLKNSPEKRIVYISSESFVNDYIDAIKANNIVSFRKRYRNTDVLLIDDVQFFAGKERCQEEFFHTFNDLFNSGKQIILSCDKPLNEVSDIEQRLVSRFGWGVSADIQAPDYETRLAILQKKIDAMNGKVAIDSCVLDYLARRFTKNIRRMEGALNNLIGYATLIPNGGKEISIEKAQELLAAMIMQEDENQIVDIEAIQKITSDYYKIDIAEMTGKRRPKNIAMARQIAMYISRKLTSHSLQEIGKRFGGRDHGTVMHAISVVEHEIEHDENTKRSVDFLMQNFS